METTANTAKDDRVQAAVRQAFLALEDASEAMLDVSGGECGRDFTPAEHEAFEAILNARNALRLTDAFCVACMQPGAFEVYQATQG